MKLESTPAYAQTNIQLYNQLINSGYSEDEMGLVANGYNLAIRLFASVFRANGKPFINHLVGTGSILVSMKSSAELVTAGLLHAVYEVDMVENLEKGTEVLQKSLAIKKSIVTNKTGSVVENIITRYQFFEWNEQSIQKIINNPTSLTDLQRQIVLLRLANELEEHLDFGMLYCKKSDYEGKKIRPELVIELAKCSGYSSLENQLRDAFRKTDTTIIPDILRRDDTTSFFIRKK